MTWTPGKDKIADLLAAGELEQVNADDTVANALIADANRHLATATTARDSGDLSGAYQLAYDALRKSATALLAIQGIRPTSRGGIAVQDAIVAQFGSTVPAFKAFGRIRRARNRFEYPDAESAGPNDDDVNDAILTATDAKEAADTILAQDLLTIW